MRLVTYDADDGALRPGILLDDRIVDTEAAAAAAGIDVARGGPWRSNRRVLEAGRELIDTLRRGANELLAENPGRGLPLGQARLGPPMPDPPKIICLGLNYRDHAAEVGLELPTVPTVFAKYANSLAGPRDEIVVPPAAEQVDYEAELAVVVGRRCRDVSAEDALACVAGAMALNDVSARDLQHATSGKAIDTFAPCGPALVLLDELPDLQLLAIRTRVNGRTVQESSTAEMVFPVAETIAFLSRTMTLEAGDIVATGTPAGVGVSREPQVLLHDGDLVEVEIEGIGTLANPVRAAVPEAPAR